MGRCGCAGLRYWLAFALACAAVLAGCGDAPDAVAPASAQREPDGRPVVLFLGTSLTAGYGLPSNEAFPALLQQRIDAAGLAYRVVNAGVSGDTSAGGLSRLGWLLRLPLAVLVVELGANDMLRGLDVGALQRNLTAIVERAQAAHPGVRVVVVGMRAPPNLGGAYVDAFETVYSQLAQEHDATLVPFLLEGVAAVPQLNQPDGIHPNAEGQRRVAETVWPALSPLLR
ncbi:MAG: arylesterase [Myxococcota bacterium]|jgi:acyl-CoA thioesterase-1|nr:arylesterase [Deltaproteobacteria bacterium]MCP4244287.1 arylesterase [bacterium]MDP6074926.1 arylesterase [Myxococcota bacterium]MBT40136.1 arylesterase [Deltaproteobacteria bacterium]MDP6241893.1 arylesterase [Myxococcota bacterium]